MGHRFHCLHQGTSRGELLELRLQFALTVLLQTFAAVVPTERTCISVKVVDGSLRVRAPVHPGAIVLSIGGLHFATDIIGDAPDSSFRLDIASTLR